MKHLLTVNGLDGPLRKQFGCDCARCADPTRQANTSISLITLNEVGDTVYHHLFDAGSGVIDSLVTSPFLASTKARLDGIVLSHWHPDHTVGLNQLCESYHLNLKRRGVTAPKIPFWCRSGTADRLKDVYGYELNRFLALKMSDECLPPGRILAQITVPEDGLKVTPITVSHYSADVAPNGNRDDPMYACAAFVLQTGRKKAVLLWDIDNQNEWLANPQIQQEIDTVELISNADHLFIDTCFWHKPSKRATHPSIANVHRYVRTLQPKETLLMHISGHPDGRNNPGYGWTNQRWTAEAKKSWANQGLPGIVRVPEIGDVFDLGF